MYVSAVLSPQTTPAILQYKSASVFNIVRNPKYVCKYEDGRGPTFALKLGQKAYTCFIKRQFNSQTLWKYTSVEILIES